MMTAELKQAAAAPIGTPRSTPSRAPAAEKPAAGSLAPLLLTALGLCLFVLVANLIRHGRFYTPRSAFGFTLGVAGTLMMLALLAYPLRKHVRSMQRWGALKHWFRLHMFLGITAPMLVLFHSAFHIRSVNAAVALFSMLGVMLSGIVGRFVYTKIHLGLYGRRLTLEAVQAQFDEGPRGTTSAFRFSPRVQHWLQGFERHAMDHRHSLIGHAVSLTTLSLRRSLLEWRCARELRATFNREGLSQFHGDVEAAVDLATTYLREVQRVAQFSLYERLFSLWHIAHIPLIYLLAVSTLVHIVAAYMY